MSPIPCLCFGTASAKLAVALSSQKATPAAPYSSSNTLSVSVGLNSSPQSTTRVTISKGLLVDADAEAEAEDEAEDEAEAGPSPLPTAGTVGVVP